jgi:hypothetical protein
MAALSITSGTALRPAAPARRFGWLRWPQDRWLTTTFVIAVIASVASWWYFYSHHEILLYGDAYSHMLIARALLDNATPGFAQLGGVWLPLPHLIMQPFIWSDYLWRTGLAGSFSSMPCYVIAATYLFLTARRLTHDSRASFIGTLVFILNPNILYLQTTPLTEPVLIATMTMACYYFVAWVQDEQPLALVWCAACTFLATLARYDGWVMFLAFLLLIVVIGLLKRRSRVQIEANAILFGSLGGLGILLWLLWNQIIFGDALYFERGPYSAQAQQQSYIQGGTLYTYHNLGDAIRYYAIGALEVVGPIILVLGLVALLAFILRRRLTGETLALLAFLAPSAFYIYSIFSGQAVMYVPGAEPANAISRDLFNARYAAVIVAPAAIYIATLLATLLRRVPLAQFGLVGVLLVQTALTIHGGIVTLQDGQYGLSCAPSNATTLYLAQHYNGGFILEDTYRNPQDFATAGIDFKNVVYQGSRNLWDNALSDPSAVVEWIVLRPGDLVAQHINTKTTAFKEDFTLVYSTPGGPYLYHKNGLGPLPVRSLPAGLLSMHQQCDAADSHGQTHTNAPAHPSTHLPAPARALPGKEER